MRFPIVRGRFSHSLRDDVAALTFPLRFRRDFNIVNQYEKQMSGLVGTNHCVSFAFARTAFWAVLKSLDLPKDSKVILPSITIKPMLDVVLHLGLQPVFVDTDTRTGSVDISSLQDLLKQEARVLLLTYLFGIVPDMEEIMGVLKNKDVFVIEDFSQCLGGQFDGKRIGTFGNAAILSTSAVKTLDTYGGGLLFLNSLELFDSVKRIRDSLTEIGLLAYYKKVFVSLGKNLLTGRTLFPIVFLFVWLSARSNSRHFLRFVGSRSNEPLKKLPEFWFRKLSPWQARSGLKYVKRLEAGDLRRTEIAREYAASFDFVGSHLSPKSKSVYWQCVVTSFEPTALRSRLANFGVDSAQTSLVLLSQLPKYGWDLRNTNIGARTLYENGVYVPLYSQLRNYEVQRVIKALRMKP